MKKLKALSFIFILSVCGISVMAKPAKEKLLISNYGSCTVEVRVGFLGLGGKVSATAETCEEAWANIKSLLKKKK